MYSMHAFHSCSMSIHIITMCISDVRDLFVWLSDSAVHAGACLCELCACVSDEIVSLFSSPLYQ